MTREASAVRWTERDLRDLEGRGIAVATVDEQVRRLRAGFAPAALERPCTVGDGLHTTTEAERRRAAERFDEAMRAGRTMKFVPASGAASRMFKSLQAIRSRGEPIDRGRVQVWSSSGDPDERECARFLGELETFAFFPQLRAALDLAGHAWPQLWESGDLQQVLRCALAEDGLGLADLPKGLIPFHRYGSSSRTAFEEHLVEGLEYARDGDGRVRLHCTVPPAQEAAIEDHLRRGAASMAARGHFDLEFSTQSASTDTVALDGEGAPLRHDDGSLVFRPGGHGALLENLDRLGGDVVLIKNIDNVVPDHLRAETILYKKVLGGLLLETQARIFGYLDELEASALGETRLREMERFVEDDLSHTAPAGTWARVAGHRAAYLRRVLDRPLRVCGMVKNEGEPGGGPFWVRQPDGSVTLQIIEQVQVKSDDPLQASIFERSTHFNPVDLVCALRDRKGHAYALAKFRDPETGIVTMKSKDAQVVRALELPGLWNGSMAWWNTRFVEVPLSTFNPVKTVTDLLRPAHQPGP